jgi:hypothetical protein
MISRAALLASAIVIAGFAAGFAQADGIGIGFFLGSGPSDWLPKCKAPEILTEIKDEKGKLHWVCRTPAPPKDTTAGVQPRNAYAQR